MIPYRLLASLFSPAGRKGKLSILIFHRVLPAPDPLFPGEVDIVRFERILAWLGDFLHVLPLDEALDRLRGGSLPPGAAAITFDDGYADNYVHALPILLRRKMHATFFVATDFLDGGRMWNDLVIDAVRVAKGSELDLSKLDLGRHRIETVSERRQTIDSLLGRLKYLQVDLRSDICGQIGEFAGYQPDNPGPMMTTEQLLSLRSAGMGIGGHTASHPILLRLSDEQAFDEIARGKRRLEAMLNESISLFAYPNGKPGRDYARRHAEMARAAGFRAALSTAAGAADSRTDLFQLPRFTPWDLDEMRFKLRLTNNMRSRGATAS